jgi:hypothetical protein
VETICGQTSQCVLMSFFCFVYDFQTLLAGAVAIIVAIIAGLPVGCSSKTPSFSRASLIGNACGYRSRKPCIHRAPIM